MNSKLVILIMLIIFHKKKKIMCVEIERFQQNWKKKNDIPKVGFEF